MNLNYLGPRIRQADDPQLPCEQDLQLRVNIARGYGTRMTPTPFDTLADITGEWRSRHILAAARQEAMTLCNQCPVRDTCWEANADEEWLTKLTHQPTTAGEEVA